MITLPLSLWYPPPSLSKTKSKSGSRRSQYAIRASEGHIVLPSYEEMGYLTTTRLIRRAQADDNNAIHELWVRNARLCFTVANKIRVRSDLVADLIQESQEAFPKAIRNFEIERLLEFSTYAHAAIRSHMLRARCRILFSTSIPSQLYGTLIQYITQITNAPTRSHWFDARERMLDEGLYNRARDLDFIANPSPIESAQGTLCLNHCPEQSVTLREDRAVLQHLLQELEPRDCFVLVHRYGLWDRPEMTLQQLGDLLNVTRERVRQLQLIAEHRLRTLIAESDLSITQTGE